MEQPPCLDKPADSVLGTIIGGALIGAFVSTALLVAAAEAAGGAAAGAAGAGAAFVGAVIIIVLLVNSPGCDPGPVPGCVAGIVNYIDLAGEYEDSVFPWMEGHPSVRLVTRSQYWPFLMKPKGEGGPEMAGVDCIPVGRHSPYIVCFYYSEKVCNSFTGAMVGAVAGGVGGIYLSILTVTAIACSGFFACLFAMIIAAIIAAVATLVGAIVGGQAGAASGTPQPPEESEAGIRLSVGDYVTLKGNFQDSGRNKLVGWFVTNTSLHGKSVLNPPYSHTEADLFPALDDCTE